MVGIGNVLDIFAIGSNHFQSTYILSKTLAMKNILHIPYTAKNILSESQFAQDNNV